MKDLVGLIFRRTLPSEGLHT